jgi:hypothetical protein
MLRSRMVDIAPASPVGAEEVYIVTVPAASETPWSVLEWAATGVSTSTLGVIAFVWRQLARMARLESLVSQQRNDLDAAGKTDDAQAERLTERLDHVLADHHRLRATIAALPTRYDLRDVEDHINERIDSIVARLDRALEIRGN